MPTSSPAFAHDDSLLEMCAPFILKARSRPFDFDPQETRMLEVVSHQPTPPNSQMPMGWILALSWFRFVYHFTRALSADNFLFSVPFRLKAKRKKKRSHIFHFLDLIRIWLIPIQQFTLRLKFYGWFIDKSWSILVYSKVFNIHLPMPIIFGNAIYISFGTTSWYSDPSELSNV